MDRLLEIMRRLRGPGGCPWDREQSFATIAPYTLEEAYEVDDAIRREDMDDLRDELGDLLFQVVFHAQMASEAGAFAFGDVVEGISDKLERRHPHVFASVERSAGDLGDAWQAIKTEEREARARARGEAAGPYAGIPATLPALSRSAKLHERARSNAPSDAQLRGALEEVLVPRGEVGVDAAHERVGALLFALVRQARALGVDAERALRDANSAFEARTAT